MSIPFKRAGSREIQYLEFDEIQAVLRAVDTKTRNGFRDLALLSLMFNLNNAGLIGEKARKRL